MKNQELIVDSFAGGGGASLGIEMALGRSPDIAINHDEEALSMHAANHPDTLHLPHNIWKVDPIAVTNGRPVGLLWASPDCKHFSKAKGGRPVKKNIRDLAWVVVRWAKQVRPRVICLENVEEFTTWGPLTADNQPCPERRGQTFKQWVGELRRLGYKVEWRELRACDYGAPTIRKRLFLIARRDGRPIVWPEPTHGDPKSDAVKSGKLQPWRTAAGIIDWSLPCHSIFLTREEGRAVGVKRPLADATMARIAKGVWRYVINAPQPFIVSVAHGYSGGRREYPIDHPLGTVTGQGRAHAVVAPVMTYGQQGGANRDAAGPLHTVTASLKDTNALAAVHLTKFNSNSVGVGMDEPAPTVTANSFIKRPGGCAPIGVVSAMISRQFGGSVGSSAESPVGTITAGGGKSALVAATMVQTGYGEREGQQPRALDIHKPLGTVVASNKHAAVTAFLAQHNSGVVGHDAREPVSTVTMTGSHQAVVSAGLVSMRGSDRRDSAPDAPQPTVTAQGTHSAEVRAFLTKYYGEGSTDQAASDPLHTIPTVARFGLVMVEGQPYEIVDIGMRMLTRRELFRAQGFPDSYEIERGHDGRVLTQSASTRMCGNSVSPVMAKAIAGANYSPTIEMRPASKTGAGDLPLFEAAE